MGTFVFAGDLKVDPSWQSIAYPAWDVQALFWHGE